MSFDRKCALNFLRDRRGGRRAPADPFVQHVRTRLGAESSEPGDQCVDRPLRGSLADMRDDAADLAGNAALVDQHSAASAQNSQPGEPAA